MERTLILLKPGVLQRRIAGEIITRLERKGFRIIAAKMLRMDRALAENHYAQHLGQSWYPRMEKFMTAGPIMAMVLSGPDSIALVRKMCGATAASNAEPGTIRGDYALGRNAPANIIHASDSQESAEKEIPLFFRPEEILDWDDPNGDWC